VALRRNAPIRRRKSAPTGAEPFVDSLVESLIGSCIDPCIDPLAGVDAAALASLASRSPGRRRTQNVARDMGT
jgi:hypothetical protein